MTRMTNGRWLRPSLALAMTAALLAGTPAQADRRVAADMSKIVGETSQMWRDSVGADHGGMLLRRENVDQLELTQREIGFRYIRFHAIFLHDTDPYREIDGRPYYNFDRVAQIYANALKAGIKPFVEVGFMPTDLASDSRTIFHWKGNGSPPKDWQKWSDFITAFTRDMEARFGREEVRSWRFEVWNEPNLDGFWTKGDQASYFKLYDTTVRAIKDVDPELKVGGPATAGAAWAPEFLAHARQVGSPVDFVTTHTYGVAGGFFDEKGEGDNRLVLDRRAVIDDVEKVRGEIDRSPFPGLPLYITEWSTSYNPRDPIHDTYLNAAFILNKLKGTEKTAQSMSYWVYSDLFEEAGPPPTPFHGGFGLLTREGVRKPSYFAYRYLSQLGKAELGNADAESWLTRDGDNFAGLIWNYTIPDQKLSNRPYYTRIHPAQTLEPVQVSLTAVKPGSYRLRVYRTGYRANDAYTTYMEWGRPDRLTDQQLARLQAQTRDTPEVDRTVKVGADGRFEQKIDIRTNDILLVRLDRM